MPPTLRPVLSLVAAALVLTACGGSEEPSADPSRRRALLRRRRPPRAPSPRRASEPSPTTPAADTTADPCSLLEAADYAALVDEQARDLVAEQIGQYGPFMGCRVYWQVYAGLTYGFAIDPDAFDEATAEPEPGESAEAVDVAGAERASLTTGTDGSIAVHAEAGGTTFLVAQGGTDDGDTAMSRGSTQDVLDVAATLVANGAGRISSTAVLLPDTCPAADAPVTTDLLGTVEYARGGSNPQGIAACGYAGADGAGAGSSYTFLAPADLRARVRRGGRRRCRGGRPGAGCAEDLVAHRCGHRTATGPTTPAPSRSSCSSSTPPASPGRRPTSGSWPGPRPTSRRTSRRVSPDPRQPGHDDAPPGGPGGASCRAVAQVRVSSRR